MVSQKPRRGLACKVLAGGILLAGILLAASLCRGAEGTGFQSPNMFEPRSTPADSIFHLSILVFEITGLIFAVVFSLLVYAVVRFRKHGHDNGHEPPQVFGSNQMELAWTVLPILIVLVLFFSTARVIHAIQDTPNPPDAIEVIAVGHQFWWEFRYPKLGVLTANELHIPVSERSHPTPTFITLLSADTDHSFWVPRLGGKVDLIPNRVNHTWFDPREPGIYLGQCAQYCGTQHAKMLLRVYVDPPEKFHEWIAQQKQVGADDSRVAAGRRVFVNTACMNCHAVAGTSAAGVFGPDLTHLMSRETLASGAAPNTPENLKAWIRNPDAMKPGSLMPAMKVSEEDLDSLVAYLETLR
jgi:cytochrome c oxidase subunit II